ncbi:MAG: tepA [Herbinix sp.]|jgi:ATP-dependent protease ClpP protease subunit|nr:tepA [Herbinix sp.]
MQKDILLEDDLQSNNQMDDNRRGDKIKKTQEGQENEKVIKENEDLKDQKISEYGQTLLENGKKEHKIHLLSIIGEIEGHECLPQHNKTTKYEHVLPQLAAIEDSSDIDGLLILINTVGGDVEAGLAIAEMIASLSKPTVSLVLGGSHSIGVPLAVSANYSYIVPTATMIIHPVRMNGTVIGVTQTFEYFEKIQDRIINFVVTHSNIDYASFKNLMLDTNQLAKDVGSILVGEETVKKGIINEVGGIKEALAKINEMIDSSEEKNNTQINNLQVNNAQIDNTKVDNTQVNNTQDNNTQSDKSQKSKSLKNNS